MKEVLGQSLDVKTTLLPTVTCRTRPFHDLWRGTGGREPGRKGVGRGRREGGKRDS